MKISELTDRVGGRLVGRGDVLVEGLASLAEAGARDVSFLNDVRYAAQLGETKAAAVLVPSGFEGSLPMSLIFVDDVDAALEQLLEVFQPEPDVPQEGIHKSAWIAESAELAEKTAIGANAVVGENVRIGQGSIILPGCVIGREVIIGENCYLGANVVVNQRCVIGNNVKIYGNSTIGTDGFGYRLVDGKHRKIPHAGIVVIEDDVEIGANSCVDRAKFGKTVIGRGTKIDNLVQIAHNVQIGEHSIIVSQTGIAGSTKLGKYVVLGGQCGVKDHVNIGDGVMAGAQCGINGDVEPGEKIVGSPFRPFRVFFRELSMIQKLPDLAKQIKQLRKKVEQFANTKNDC